MKKKTVLFGGYAPVHFVCFRPLYEALSRRPDVEVFVTGGLRRTGRNGETRYDGAALYRPFGIPKSRILPLSAIRRRSFDMTFSAHTSGFFPRRTKTRVQVFHGLSFRNLAVREDQEQYDALFVAGPYMMRRFKKDVFGRGGARKLLPIGFVKLDRLVDGTLDPARVRRELGLDGKRPVILYAPTGDKKNSLETMGEEVIRRLRDAGRWDVLIKLHDHPKNRDIDWPRRLKPLLGRHVKLVGGYDVVPYLLIADLLISDASSVANEYSVLDRPIVFLDVPGLIAKAKRKGALVDLSTWGRRGGITVRRPEDVVATVRRALARPGRGSRIRKAMARDLFYEPGTATTRAMEWILRTLGIGAGEARAGRKRNLSVRRAA